VLVGRCPRVHRTRIESGKRSWPGHEGVPGH
jgi:hypothetical protein